MNEDKDLLYEFGELTDDELVEWEQSLAVDQRAQSEALRTTFADLKRLNDNLPEPQISFQRVQDAILASQAKATGTKRAFAWGQLFRIAVPVAGAALLGIVLVRSQLPSSSGTAASGIPINRIESMDFNPDAPAAVASKEPEKSATPSVSEVEAAPVTVEVPTSAVRTADRERPMIRRRRPARVLVADQRDFGPRVSRGLPGAAKVKTPEGTMSAASSETMSSPAPVVTEFGSVGAGAVETNAPTVVVVTSTPDAQTGANTAMEVKKSDDVVLGG